MCIIDVRAYMYIINVAASVLTRKSPDETVLKITKNSLIFKEIRHLSRNGKGQSKSKDLQRKTSAAIYIKKVTKSLPITNRGIRLQIKEKCVKLEITKENWDSIAHHWDERTFLAYSSIN